MTDRTRLTAVLAAAFVCAASPLHAQVLPGGLLNRAENMIERGDENGARNVLQRADRLSAKAAFLLGSMCEDGRGGPADLDCAVAAYASAANDGLADAQYAMGRLVLAGTTGRADAEPDPSGAADWFALAVVQEHPQAMVALGRLHAEGNGVAIDEVYAADLFERAARVGDPEGAYELARAYQLGRGRAQSFDRARRWYEPAVDAGHIDAQYRLGLLLRAGLGGAPDPARAEQLIRAAALADHPAAMTAVGVMTLRSGAGSGEMRAAQAADWFERGAEAGDDEGMFLLAVVYAQGRGRPMDAQKALELVEASLAAAPSNLNPRERAARIALRDALLAPPEPEPDLLAEGGDGETPPETPQR